MGGLIKNNKILHYIRRTKSSDLHLLCQVVGTNASEHRNSALPLVFFLVAATVGNQPLSGTSYHRFQAKIPATGIGFRGWSSNTP